MDKLKNIREEYFGDALLETQLPSEPLSLFEQWFTTHLQQCHDTPNAMVLSTVDKHNRPDSRIVLLKNLDKGAFVFYTNYYSAKGLQLDDFPFAALNFYWPESKRQVRVRGKVQRTSQDDSDAYFASRPRESQLSAIASPQSTEVSSRVELEQALGDLIKGYTDKTIERPQCWGGFMVVPDEVEFWQGRENRLHDRIQYSRKKDTWHHRRLAP